MMVSKCIVSAQSNKPVMGIVQDALLSCRLLTTRNEFLTKSEMMNIMMVIKGIKTYELPVPCILKLYPLWSGKTIDELIIPNISMHRYAGWHNEDNTLNFSEGDTELIIDNGEYIAGTL